MSRAPHGQTRGRRKSATRRVPIGAPPGTLVADPQALKPHIDVIAYGPSDLERRSIDDPHDAAGYLGTWPVTWINMTGLADLDIVRSFGKMCDLHGLALEDAINTHQRAKFEEYDTFAFVAVRMPVRGDRFETEQLSLFLGRDFVLTFQERPGDCFEPIRERLRKTGVRIREQRADYLVYTLIDAVIDSYFPILEAYGEKVEALEEALIQGLDGNRVPEIYALKRDLLNIRRAIWPLREMTNAFLRDSTHLVATETKVFIRDCYDHTVQLMEMVETYREIASNLIELHLSAASNRLNEVMKVLTIIATIFIPLGFVAGVYGMNFDPAKSPWNMPELRWYWGYPFALGLMATIAGGLILYFRRKGWIGNATPRRRRRAAPAPAHRNGGAGRDRDRDTAENC